MRKIALMAGAAVIGCAIGVQFAATSVAVEAGAPGVGFAATPGAVGGQDVFGPYDIVKDEDTGESGRLCSTRTRSVVRTLTANQSPSPSKIRSRPSSTSLERVISIVGIGKKRRSRTITNRPKQAKAQYRYTSSRRRESGGNVPK